MSKKLIKQITYGSLLCLQLSGVAIPTMGAFGASTVYAVDGGGYNIGADDCDLGAANADNKDETAKASGDANVSSASLGEDAWLKEGTEEYKVAKKIFETFTNDYGTSGAFAAGVLSNVKGESNFIPDVMEGGVRAGMDNRDGKSYNSAMPGQEGGGGLFQFTGYSKFSHSKWFGGRKGSKGWDVENQVDAVWGLEFGNRAVENYFSRTGKSNFSTVEDLISTDDPALASEYFQMAYERPLAFHAERAVWAKRANEVFNKDNIKADKSKFKFDAGGTSNATASISVTSKEDKQAMADCNIKEEKKSTGGAWGKDGTGKHNQNVSSTSWGLAWKPEDLPDDLKPYAIDPESVGIKFGAPYTGKMGTPDSNGWINCYPPAPGQCTELSLSIAYAVWKKDGKGMQYSSPNGSHVTRQLASELGGSVSDEPRQGAIFSQAASGNHTGMVSHVFENGDILIIEENVAGYSGYSIGQPNTWNYRLMSPAAAKVQADAGYWYPGDNGFTVNPDVKTMG